jgi:spore coat protein H
MRKYLIPFISIIMMLSLSACSSKTIEKTDEKEETTVSPISTLADTSNYYGTTFGQGEITDINIEISDADWTDIKNNAKEEAYHSADITVNGTTVENIGFRAKGFSSLNSVANSDSDRYGFKVKLDEYVDDQTLNGLDTLVLNANFSDPSYMREYLTYAASNFLGGITPYLTYTRLSINGELFGFYLCIEAYDDSFVERTTNSEDSVLYKAVSENCTLLPSDDGSGFDVEYGEDDDASNLKNLITVLNSTTSENKEKLEAILDIDSVLKAIAVNTVMGNYDSYSGSKAHNYYLLYSNGKFSYIGWDYNMSIGGFMEDNGASVDVDLNSPVYSVDLSQRPLIEKLLAIDEYKERYMKYINSLTDYFSDFDGMVSDIEGVIQADVESDPSAFYTKDEFVSNLTVSDTDLTQVESNQFGGKGGNGFGNMQRQDGDVSNTADGEKSYSSYGDAPDMTDGNRPNWSYGDGDAPDMTNDDGKNMQQPNGGGNMMSKNVVSIIDYITQRIDNIKGQL